MMAMTLRRMAAAALVILLASAAPAVADLKSAFDEHCSSPEAASA